MGKPEGPTQRDGHMEVGGREPCVAQAPGRQMGPVYRGAQGGDAREIGAVAPDFPGSVVWCV